MNKQSKFHDGLIRLSEGLKNPEVLRYLCDEVPDQILIRGEKMLKIIKADGDYEIDDDLGDVHAIGLPLEYLNEIVADGISSPNQISKGDKIRIKYVVKRMDEYHVKYFFRHTYSG